jgi:hypothetical protein
MKAMFMRLREVPGGVVADHLAAVGHGYGEAVCVTRERAEVDIPLPRVHENACSGA